MVRWGSGLQEATEQAVAFSLPRQPAAWQPACIPSWQLPALLQALEEGKLSPSFLHGRRNLSSGGGDWKEGKRQLSLAVRRRGGRRWEAPLLLPGLPSCHFLHTHHGSCHKMKNLPHTLPPYHGCHLLTPHGRHGRAPFPLHLGRHGRLHSCTCVCFLCLVWYLCFILLCCTPLHLKILFSPN